MNDKTVNPELDENDESVQKDVRDKTGTKKEIPKGLKKIGAELIGSMPEVSENAINQYNEEQQEQQSVIDSARVQAAGKVDRHGNSFDPSKHKVDENGLPLLTAKGKLRMLAGAGRPKASATQKRSTLAKSSLGGGGVSSPEDVDKRIQARATGTAAANTLIMLGVVIGGDEWQPMANAELGIDEKTNLETAFADYFEATGKSDFPPGMALSVAVVAYAAPRFTMPKTKKKSTNFLLWIRDKWQARKLKREHAKGLKQKEREKAVEKKEDK